MQGGALGASYEDRLNNPVTIHTSISILILGVKNGSLKILIRRSGKPPWVITNFVITLINQHY